jgi:hypothetical protein
MPTAYAETRSEWLAVKALGIDHRRESLGDPVDAGVVRRNEPAVRRRRGEALAGEVGEEPVGVGQRQEHVGDARVEPAAAAHAHHLAGGLEAVLRDEDVGRLRQAGDAGEQWDGIATQLVRLAAHRPSARRDI